MKHIGSEHEAQIKAEIEAAARREHQAKVRKLCTIALGVIILGISFHKRAELGQRIYRMTHTQEEIEDAAIAAAESKAAAERTAAMRKERIAGIQDARANLGGNLKAIKGMAAQRDTLLEEFSK